VAMPRASMVSKTGFSVSVMAPSFEWRHSLPMRALTPDPRWLGQNCQPTPRG